MTNYFIKEGTPGSVIKKFRCSDKTSEEFEALVIRKLLPGLPADVWGLEVNVEVSFQVSQPLPVVAVPETEGDDT